jgi:hypothetical protein
MKTLINWIAWISAGIGIVILILGALQILFGIFILGVTQIANVFLAADTCFLITIASFVFLIKCQGPKE